MDNYLRHYLRWLPLLSAFALLACTQAPEKTSFSGYVEAERIYIAAPQSGWITQSSVTEGQQVSSGEPLFKLDDERQLAQVSEASFRLEQAQAQEKDASKGARREEIEALLARKKEAEAALELARSEKIRWSELIAKGLAAESKGNQVQADFDASVARLQNIEASIQVAKLGSREDFVNSTDAAKQAARAVLEQARWQLQQRSVSAMVGGQVDEIFYRQGEFVNAGVPVLALLPQQGLKVRFYVPQAKLTRFKVGDGVVVRADGIDSPIMATIFHIASSVEFTPPVIYDKTTRQKLLFMLEARLPVDSELHPGLPVEVDLP